MKTLIAVLALLTSLVTFSQDSLAEQTKQAQGIVFHDANQNQKFDEGEKPLPGIRVSNGTKITKTDEQGRYQLPVTDDTILFVIKPSGWKTPLDENNLPQFYYVHKPEGSPQTKFPGVSATGALPKSIDFPLTPQEEPETFRAIMFGDTQPRNQQEVDWIAHDVVEELIGTDASFGVTLGDIVFDDLKMMQALNKTIALIDIPWYNVIGNHDINYDANERRFANETYESIYGPSYYSFDYGSVHFVAIDNIDWIVDERSQRRGYRGGLGPEQLEFIKADLEMVPDDQLVVLMMHIPLTDVTDRQDLYRLIEKRKFCISISGHTHYHKHVWVTKEDGWEGPEPHHHIINVTVCGSWWSGMPDERGIPHTTMADGAPNGYSIFSFDGSDYKLDFYAAGRDKSYQMEIDAAEELPADETAQLVYINVFNGSEKTKVKVKIDDTDWQQVKKVDEADPKYRRSFEKELTLLAEQDPPPFRKLPGPKVSGHLWKTTLPSGLKPGVHIIRVEATDQWNRTFHGNRIFRVLPE